MSTNYYAYIIPSKERKKELHDAIEANDFSLIEKLTIEMYAPIKRDWDTNKVIGGIVHLGKRSGGWKFLWDPNVFVVRNGHLEDIDGIRKYVSDPDTAIYTYPLTKRGIKDFIDREDVLIYDEFGELQDKEEFWNMALTWSSDKKNGGWDASTYEAWEGNSYPVTGELTELLKQEGYIFTSPSNSDFYSDGLRFAGFTDFS